MAPPRDSEATRTAKVLALPTRQRILALLLRAGPKTVTEIAEAFGIHPNVARSHLDLMVEAGFLSTETRRGSKGRPAKIYFTWEGEIGAFAEAGIEVPEERETRPVDELEVELRVLERMLQDATQQLERLRTLIREAKRVDGSTPEL